MPSQPLQKLADSAGLKVASYLINVVILPMGLYFGARVFAQLDSMQAQISHYETTNAVLDQRVQALEKLVPERQAQISHIGDVLLRHELEIQQLKDGKK